MKNVVDPIRAEFEQLWNAPFGTPEWSRMKELSDMLLEQDNAEWLFQQYFGHESLTTAQSAAIDEITSGRDSLVVIPTGGGKSAIYQVSALKLDGMTIVIEPLIALMQDQVSRLNQIGITAATINSSMTKSNREQVESMLCAGEIKLLYLAPESIRTVMPLLDNVSLIAVDEAHCISQWGHEFRPRYRELSQLREHFPHATFAAFTASATHEVRKDIIDQLQMNDPYIYIGSFDRPNLNFSVIPTDSDRTKIKHLVDIVGKHSPSIVYARTKKSTEVIATQLERYDIPAQFYHAGMTRKGEREEAQRRFMAGEVNVLVATIAFGMGIDNQNIRAVVHYDIPDSMERYHQETGRAGRDGNPAECVLLYSDDDVDGAEFMLEKRTTNTDRLEVVMDKLYQMKDFANSGGNYRQQIINYFTMEGGE